MLLERVQRGLQCIQHETIVCCLLNSAAKGKGLACRATEAP